MSPGPISLRQVLCRAPDAEIGHMKTYRGADRTSAPEWSTYLSRRCDVRCSVSAMFARFFARRFVYRKVVNRLAPTSPLLGSVVAGDNLPHAHVSAVSICPKWRPDI